MIDGLDETCWQYSTNDGGVNAYVDVTFSQICQVTSLWVKNGYWKISNGNDQYTRNSRPKTIQISFLSEGASEYAEIMKLDLADDSDRKDWQRFVLEPYTNIKQLRIQVLDIYYGTKFPEDVAISEIKLMGHIE